MSDYKPTRRRFLQTASAAMAVLPFSLDGLVQETIQEGPHYVVTLSGDTYNGKYNLRNIDQESLRIKPTGHERDAKRELKGTADQIMKEYIHLVARGVIPNVRHLHAKVGELAQLMSRDSNYLANQQNGFVFDKEETLSTRELDSIILGKDGNAKNITLIYQMENVYIAGAHYNIILEFIGSPLNNRTDYRMMGVGGWQSITVQLKLNKNERIFYQWTASENSESWAELRVLDGERGSLREVIANISSSSDDDTRPMQTLDLSGTIRPLIEALKRQVVYFDKDWNPIKPR